MLKSFSGVSTFQGLGLLSDTSRTISWTNIGADCWSSEVISLKDGCNNTVSLSFLACCLDNRFIVTGSLSCGVPNTKICNQIELDCFPEGTIPSFSCYWDTITQAAQECCPPCYFTEPFFEVVP
jgi:hypothetical protein